MPGQGQDNACGRRLVDAQDLTRVLNKTVPHRIELRNPRYEIMEDTLRRASKSSISSPIGGDFHHGEPNRPQPSLAKLADQAFEKWLRQSAIYLKNPEAEQLVLTATAEIRQALLVAVGADPGLLTVVNWH
ncbi:hypothetical protein FRB99_007558 [Tulasnella sp. 403]|nr:hypothetical protein FRB99_007558 [Tulasnella sp. 403]